MKKALLSVSNKNGILDFAKFLIENNYKILSTGGTLKYLNQNQVEAKAVEEVTNFPEILDGRVKTLHPAIHGGILGRSDKAKHQEEMLLHQIERIDMVVVNLYPFFENADKELSDDELIEFIDIGGPTMLRAAAKSYFDVCVITEVEDYKKIKEEILENNEISLATRKKLAGKVFNLTSAYDSAIAQKLLGEDFPKYYTGSYKKTMDLRYGENPHQNAAFYTKTIGVGAMKDFEQLNGKELSFNNIRDMDLAWKVVMEFQEPACCAVKHSTPCGVALADNLSEAYQKAYNCDSISIFGGIVAFNKKVDLKTAKLLNETFLEIVLSFDFETEALIELQKKKNLRIIKINNPLGDNLQTVAVDGGLLVQEIDKAHATELKVVTNKKPTSQNLEDLDFALRVIKHVKSNAIVVAANKQALGVGTGETNRIWAAQQAIERAQQKETKGLVLASEAFFPFRDVVDLAAEKGIEAIVQPGGSIKDNESIAAANEHNLAMCLTGIRHFLH